MADDGFAAAVNTAAIVADGYADRHQLAPADVVAFASAVALQVIAARVGTAAAIEHLRTVADVAERELLSAAR